MRVDIHIFTNKHHYKKSARKNFSENIVTDITVKARKDTCFAVK